MVGVAVLLLSSLAMLLGGTPRAGRGGVRRNPPRKTAPPEPGPRMQVSSLTVEPAEARPGETVSLKVTAKLSPGWHIYTQAKTQEGDGPRKTIFDLFDTGGLEVAGDWKASRKPESKAEPAFDNQVFEYFEDEVTWSIPLKIPSGTPAGKKAIRCQASYQVCNAQSCSFPGRWTLPEATLTVLAADPAPAQPTKHEVQRPQLPAAPAKKDSSARIRPKGVTLTPSVDPGEAHPGQTVTYKVKAALEPGLHIYAVAKEERIGRGRSPRPSTSSTPPD